MSDSDKNKLPPASEECNCKDPNCCQPKPRRSWQKFVFLAVVFIAAGIIAFKLFYASPKDPPCNAKGCCADTAQCSGTSKCADTTPTLYLK